MNSLHPKDVAHKQPLYIIDIRPVTDPVTAEVFKVDIHTSLEQLQTGTLPDVPRATPLLVVCHYGRVSELAAAYLEAAGFSEVYNLAGGVRSYRRWLAG
jgi:rhodanese-related sulfurtransferase